MVGNPCETFLCHTRLESELAEPIKGRVSHMLEDGKLHEEDIVRRCITAGYEVLHSCLDKQLELKIPISKNMVVSGHPDGILKCGKKSFDLDRTDPLFKFSQSCYLLEITAPSMTNFALLVKDGLKVQNYQKYVQTQVYMMSDRVNSYTGGSGCVCVAKNKNTTALYEEGIVFHQDCIDELLERLGRVEIMVKKGIIPDYRCGDGRKRYCKYRSLCFDRIDFNTRVTQGVLDGSTLREADELRGLAAMWKKGKDLENESKELVETAREEFRNVIESYEAEGLVISDIKAKMVDSHSTSVDLNTLKLKAPDLYDEVVITKPNRFVRVSR